ncbi:hypothetical protein B0H13DRAFT_2035661 [Mycena leptocephala]|nr:hypothetical protein B0H13DRAFT_2035661 [Mycena leptocephala]
MVLPPLLGDVMGKYPVHLAGNSGETATIGKELASLLTVPFISLDSLCWKPGWQKSTKDEMRHRVEEALADAPTGWVHGTIVEDNCTDVICELDPPLILYLPRIIVRSVLRMLRLREPCNPGCYERFSTQIGVDTGSTADGKKMRRIGGWGRELRAWLKDVKFMHQGK